MVVDVQSVGQGGGVPSPGARDRRMRPAPAGSAIWWPPLGRSSVGHARWGLPRVRLTPARPRLHRRRGPHRHSQPAAADQHVRAGHGLGRVLVRGTRLPQSVVARPRTADRVRHHRPADRPGLRPGGRRRGAPRAGRAPRRRQGAHTNAFNRRPAALARSHGPGPNGQGVSKAAFWDTVPGCTTSSSDRPEEATTTDCAASPDANPAALEMYKIDCHTPLASRVSQLVVTSRSR